MYLNLLLLVALVLAVALGLSGVCWSPERDLVCRRRYVARHPRMATSSDISCALVRQGVTSEEAERLMDRARASGLSPYTQWRWLERFDAPSLRLVIGADLRPAEVVELLSSRQLPSCADLEVFAALNGFPPLVPIADPEPPLRSAAGEPIDSLQALALPPIYEPGTWGWLYAVDERVAPPEQHRV